MGNQEKNNALGHDLVGARVYRLLLWIGVKRVRGLAYQAYGQ
jgi:hypothetical protein